MMKLGGPEENKTVVINKNEAASSFSFRWGKPGNEAKLYFEDETDLTEKIQNVIAGITLVMDIKKKLKEEEKE